MESKFRYTILFFAALVIIFELIGVFAPGWICLTMQLEPPDNDKNAGEDPFPVHSAQNEQEDKLENSGTLMPPNQRMLAQTDEGGFSGKRPSPLATTQKPNDTNNDEDFGNLPDRRTGPPLKRPLKATKKPGGKKKDKVYGELPDRRTGPPSKRLLKTTKKPDGTKQDKVYGELPDRRTRLPSKRLLQTTKTPDGTKQDKVYGELPDRRTGPPSKRLLKTTKKPDGTKNDTKSGDLPDRRTGPPSKRPLKTTKKPDDTKRDTNNGDLPDRRTGPPSKRPLKTTKKPDDTKRDKVFGDLSDMRTRSPPKRPLKPTKKPDDTKKNKDSGDLPDRKTRPPTKRPLKTTQKPDGANTVQDNIARTVAKSPLKADSGLIKKLNVTSTKTGDAMNIEQYYMTFRKWLDVVHARSNLTLPTKLEDFENLIEQSASMRNKVKNMSQDFVMFLKDSGYTKARMSTVRMVVQSWFGGVESPGDSKTNKRMNIGLWYGHQCTTEITTNDKKCELLTLHEMLFDEDITTMVGGIATWNDVRIETLFALLSGLIGLVGTYLYVKPYCLKERRVGTCLIGICGMCLSCILQIVPIVRIASIMESIKYNYAPDVEVKTPWVLIISGIGACFACLTSGMLMFSIWSERNYKWYKFDDSPAIVFTKEPVEDKAAAGTGPYSVCGDAYDNGINA